MKVMPETTKVIFWEALPAPARMKEILKRSFKCTETHEENSAKQHAQCGKFDILIIYGASKGHAEIISLLKPCLAIVPFQQTGELSSGKLSVATFAETDFSDHALIEFIKLSVENFKTNKALQKTADRLSGAGRVTNDIIWDWDLESGYLFYNSEGWRKIFGKDAHKGKITFEDWLKFVHTEDREHVRNEFHRIIANARIQTFEVDYRMISRSGFIYVVERGYVERDEKGIAFRLLGSTQDVHAKKVAEEELKKLSAVVRETAYGVFITEINCRITWLNNAFTNLTGYTLDELKGRIPYEFLFFKEEGVETCSDFEKMMLKAEPFEQDIRLQRKDEKVVWVRINCQPQYDIRNELSGFFAIIADVSAQKSAEQKLIQNEKKFRVLVENIQDGLALVDAKGEVIEFFSGQKILGYSLKDYHSGKAKNNIHPDYLEAVDDAVQKVIQEPELPTRVEFMVKKKNGEYTWLEAIFYNLLNEDPLNAILVNFRETKESKHAEELLRQSERKYRNLFNNNPLAMFVWNPSTLRILEANDAASIQYGYDASELKNMSLRDLIHPDMEERMNAVARSSLSNTKFRTSYLTRHLDKEGRVMHLEVAFHPIDYFGSHVSMAIVKNITEQVELERRLARERELKQQEVTQAAVTAQEQERLHIGRELHDNINQILATVRLYIEYALSNPAMHDQLLKSAKDLVLNAVDEIRNLSKSLLPPTVGEKGLVAALDDLFNSIRKVNKYSFYTKWDMDEDRLPENLKLTIFRIIQEQLSNIIKHARAREIEASITMNDDLLIVNMKDDGRGFDPAVSGKGVGLKNIRSRAELHNGQMSLKTTAGKGTRLTVSFILQH